MPVLPSMSNGTAEAEGLASDQASARRRIASCWQSLALRWREGAVCRLFDKERSLLRQSGTTPRTPLSHLCHGIRQAPDQGRSLHKHWSSSDHSTIFAYLALSFIF